MKNPVPFLWFNDQAHEAAQYYEAVFPNSKITSVMPSAEGGVMLATIDIMGREFMAFNGGPMYTFSMATSFMVHCDSQEEIDHLWEKLGDGGKELACGWLTDKFGVTWQIIPTVFIEYMETGTPEQVKRIMDAMMQMIKFDIAKIVEAYEE